jgi:hypothetical protein
MAWPELEPLVALHYPKEGNGRPAVGPGRMPRIYLRGTGSTYPTQAAWPS